MGDVWGYIRVSTGRQAESGLSIEAQESMIRRYCEDHGLTLLGVETDSGISAKTMQRPSVQRILENLHKGNGNGIVATKLDRISRSTIDLLTLMKRCLDRKWGLHLILDNIDTSSAQGEFIATIMAGYAQMERRLVSDRTRIALAQKKERGEPMGANLCKDWDAPCKKDPSKTRRQARNESLARARASLKAKRERQAQQPCSSG